MLYRHNEGYNHIAIAASSGHYDWTQQAPKWQAFSLSATVTCAEIKENHPHGDNHGHGHDDDVSDG